MASNAISGVGTKFYRWDGSTWVAVAEITTINGPGKSKETIEVTSLDSTEGYREFISSFRDGGTVDLSMNFTRDGYDLMNTEYEKDTSGNFQIVLPDEGVNTSLEFVGIVQELPLAISIDSPITLDVTIKVTGKVTVTDGRNSGSPV